MLKRAWGFYFVVFYLSSFANGVPVGARVIAWQSIQITMWCSLILKFFFVKKCIEKQLRLGYNAFAFPSVV